jgi:hypothetical protein
MAFKVLEKVSIVLSGASVAVFALGCGVGEKASTKSVVASAAEIFPAGSLEDWKSYADHVVIFSVQSERALPRRDDDVAAGEGRQGRQVDLHIEEVIWSAERAPRLPADLAMLTTGWVYRDGKRLEMRYRDAPRLKVGQRYLSPMTRLELGPTPEWGPLSLGSQLGIEGSVIAEDDAIGSPGAVREQFAGRSLNVLVDAFKLQEPDPVAMRFKDLRPVERVKAVLRENQT